MRSDLTMKGVRCLCQFTRVSVTNYYTWNGLKQQKFVLERSESEVKASAGPIPCEVFMGGFFFASSWLLVVAGNPWHPLACSCSTPVSVSIITQHSPCVSVSGSSLFHKGICHIGFRAHPNEHNSILTNYIYKDLFLIKVTFTGTYNQDFNMFWGGKHK